MNASFLDELLKLGAARSLVKSAYGGGDSSGDINTVDIPHGMIGSEPMPEVDRVAPDEAGTRLQASAVPSQIKPGILGKVSPSRQPIDRERYNRAYRDRR